MGGACRVAAAPPPPVARWVRRVLLVEGEVPLVLDVVQQYVVVADPVLRRRLEARHPAAPPDDLAAKLRRPEHRVHDGFQIMARGGVTMEINRARLGEHA